MLDKLKDNILPGTDPRHTLLLKVAQRIVAANSELEELKGMQWKIYIVDDPEVNAQVLPVGF